MDLYDFLNTLVSGVANDSALAAWAAANFTDTGEVSIYVGSIESDPDYEDMPTPETDGPFIIFELPEKEHDMEDRTRKYILGFWLSLYKEGAKSRAESNVTEWLGVELINDFLTLTKAAIKNNLPGDMSVGYANEALFGQGPEFHAGLIASFKEDILIGQDPIS